MQSQNIVVRSSRLVAVVPPPPALTRGNIRGPELLDRVKSQDTAGLWPKHGPGDRDSPIMRGSPGGPAATDTLRPWPT